MHTELERVQHAYQKRVSNEDVYSLFHPAQLQAMQGVEKAVLSALKKRGICSLNGLNIGEIGCGNGAWLLNLVRWGAKPEKLFGIDLIADRVQNAQTLLPQAQIVHGSAAEIPLEDASLEIICQFTVFTSILDASIRQAVAKEMLRVLKPGGTLLWYDFVFNNPNNSDVKAVPVEEMRALFPGQEMQIQKLTLAPPIARRVAPVSPGVCSLLEILPFLRTHVLMTLQKKA